jgi:glycine dehydrogenase subunit 2
LIPYLPGPVLVEEQGAFRLEAGSELGIGRVREFLGNLPQIIKAYAWVRAMGIDGIAEASDLSVLANNYMGKRLSQIRGVTCSHPHIKARATVSKC